LWNFSKNTCLCTGSGGLLTLRSDGIGFLTSMRMRVSCSPIWYRSTGPWPFTSATVPCWGIGSETSSSTAPTKWPRTTERSLSAVPAMTTLRKLEKQPSAMTTSLAENDSLCTMPSLRARTPITRRVSGHSIKSVTDASMRSTPGATLACCRRFCTKRPWWNERPWAPEGYGICTISPASRTA
jgi:hypothetical protein